VKVRVSDRTQEVEAALMHHPAVTESVVLVREDSAVTSVWLLTSSCYRIRVQAGPNFKSEEGTGRTVAGTFLKALRRTVRCEDSAFNITGWNSSDTGRPIPAGRCRSGWRKRSGASFHNDPAGYWRSAAVPVCCCSDSPRLQFYRELISPGGS